jgi:hypothetical protein
MQCFVSGVVCYARCYARLCSGLRKSNFRVKKLVNISHLCCYLCA